MSLGQDGELGATTQGPRGESVVGSFVRAAAREPATQVFAPGTVVASRYVIERLVGRGGMGEVYRATDRELGVAVALKAVSHHRADRVRLEQRLRREVRLARLVSHPHVCRLYDVGSHEPPGGPAVTFVTMELLGGETLADLLARRGALTPADALPILTQVASALDAAHDAGVVHRDLKSLNIMLVSDGEATPDTGPASVHAVVTDFGLAGALPVGDEPAATIELAGSPAYMAPEQVLGQPTTRATDVYALGVVAFELVTGRWPFVAEGAMATAALRLHQDAPSPRSLVAELDPRWEHAILRCLRRAPGERFASAGDFVRALDDRAVEVRPARRRGLGALLAGAAVVAGLAAALFVALPRWREPAATPLGAAVPGAAPAGVYVAPAGTPDALRFALHVSGPGWENVDGVARDAAGDLYIVGHASDDLELAGTRVRWPQRGIKFAFMARLSGDGHLVWLRTLASTEEVKMTAVALDGEGGVAVTGFYDGEITGAALPARARKRFDCFLAGLDAATGAIRWTRTCGAPAGRARHVVADGRGTLYIAGELDGAASFGSDRRFGAAAEREPERLWLATPFVAAFTTGGTLRWAWAPSGSDLALAKALTFAGGAVYVGGKVRGELGPVRAGAATPPRELADGFVVKLAADSGAERWTRRFTGTGEAEVHAVDVSADGTRLAVGGLFRGSIAFAAEAGQPPELSGREADGWLAMLDPESGALASVRLLTGPGWDLVRALAFTEDGSLVVVGRTGGDLRTGELHVIGDGGLADAFVLVLGPRGEPRTLRRFGGPGDDRPSVLRVDGGLVTVGGRFEYTLALGGFTVRAHGGADGWLAQFDLDAFTRTGPEAR